MPLALLTHLRQYRQTEAEPSRINEMLRSQGLPIISDEEIDFMLTGLGVSVEDRPAAKKHILVQAAEAGGFTIIGEKPEAILNEPIFMLDIPNDRLSIRFFTRCSCVNAPLGYAVTAVAPPGLTGPLQSVE